MYAITLRALQILSKETHAHRQHVSPSTHLHPHTKFSQKHAQRFFIPIVAILAVVIDRGAVQLRLQADALCKWLDSGNQTTRRPARPFRRQLAGADVDALGYMHYTRSRHPGPKWRDPRVRTAAHAELTSRYGIYMISAKDTTLSSQWGWVYDDATQGALRT